MGDGLRGSRSRCARTCAKPKNPQTKQPTAVPELDQPIRFRVPKRLRCGVDTPERVAAKVMFDKHFAGW
jgi:hypothetical protein